jgi:polar amino acid transport system substrate-binding protein
MSITDERDEVIDFTQNYIPPAASAFASRHRRMRT